MNYTPCFVTDTNWFCLPMIVILRVHVSIQYQTNSTHLFESFYSLTSPTRVLTTHIHDIIRSTLPQLDLDDIFSSQDSIALELHRSLNGNMNQYGYIIHHALITQIRPNEHVRHSMNEMEATKREKQAMPQKAEAVKIQVVMNAEARAERARLNGVGVARERQAIASGMKEVVGNVISNSGESVTISTKGVMDLLLLTQYFDVLTDLKGDRGGKDDDVAGDRMCCLMTMGELLARSLSIMQRCSSKHDGPSMRS